MGKRRLLHASAVLLAFGSEAFLLPRLRPRSRVASFTASDDNEATNPTPGPAGRLQTIRPFLFEAKKEEEPPPPEEEPGFFRGLFRRSKDNDAEAVNGASNNRRKRGGGRDDRPKKPKQEKRKDRIKQQKTEPIKQERQRRKQKQPVPKDATTEEDKPSAFRRIQGLFNSTKTSDDESDKEAKTDSSNPISVVQKFVSNRVSSPGNKEEWITVFPKTRISPGEMVPVSVAGIDLLVIASADGGRLYCMANSCPHLGTPLETGQLVRLPTETSQQKEKTGEIRWTEFEVSKLLQQDGCEDCIVCPLHRTAFALESGEVRGEWCPYPPMLGKMMGTVKKPTSAAVFDVRYRGKNVQVRLNSPIEQASLK